MSRPEEVRSTVTASYTRAVLQPGTGCCGGGAKGVAARVAGYQADELAALPADAVSNSFGCGNPVAFAGVEEGQVVLDLGSGAGIDLLLAARKVGPSGKVIGVDMTEAMIERARANAAAAGLSNVEVRRGIIEELPVESGSVDWVISNCVINLSPEKDRVFAEVARVLKPGGRLLVSDIVAEDLPAAVRENPDLHCQCVAGAISEADYLAALEQAGFTEARVEDRLFYDPEQLQALIESELAGQAASCCGSSLADLSADLVASFAGKVWSARVSATKPA